MTELDKLEQYLKKHSIEYVRIDEVNGEMIEQAKAQGIYREGMFERHQIMVKKNSKVLWDAICHWGSYGHKDGLLEVMGPAVVRKSDGDVVAGYLTARDVIDRLEGRV
jgi:hypothetical protein